MPSAVYDKLIFVDASAKARLPSCDVMLIDEYDKSLEYLVHAIKTGRDEYKLSGLEVIRQVPRVICFSATENSAWKNILKLMRIDFTKSYPSRY